MMLSVSQQFSPTDLLRKMLTKLKGSEPITRDIGDLISELNSLLSSERYLIILDDVWVADLWNQYLKYALPDVGNKSRVLMTSRLIEVAQSADPIMEPYELKFLSEEDSRNLLIKKALPYKKAGEKCPDDLYELVAALSMKCKGLPLALIVLGGILSTKDSYPAWEKVLRTMDWPSDGKDCINVLAMSYEDMSYYLKACFLYLASFPEDSEISARCLIRMWVAEGFTPQQVRKTKEEIAEDCLEQLFQRSMVQVSSRHVDGSIKYCRVHDLLRDFAMYQAGKETFLTVFTNPRDTNHRDGATRRVSLQSCAHQFMEYVGPKTRSLFLFHLKSGLPLPKHPEFRLLRILEIGNGGWHGVIKLRGIDSLIHLKYFGISPSVIDMSECSLGRLKNLETLDFRNSEVLNLTTDFWTIITLRHVLFAWFLPEEQEVPSTADLRNLQTLEWIPFNNKTIPRLTNLRRLGLRNISTEWDVDHAVPHLLGGLPSLISLKISSRKSNLPMEIVYPRALPNYQNLQILDLTGKWSESVTLKASLFPPHLIKLSLWSSKLGQDPMPELGKLNNLKKLVLFDDVYDGKQMICPAGFPVLQSLIVRCYDVMVFTVAKGVMPKLKDLKKFGTIMLEMPPELMHLIQ
ncbi:hypothetical protein LUZ61_013509 [Rhynchospora tenuis]|uniref:NB-ARC domain-containing protein n=1 Tax=Rhynchospora tenuis TaxID=198213 RepID=A0AAD5W9J5_9POAL|nr:hypothetical protein LUZ61_013509 [Rhynchospora tenuis]